VKLRTASKNFLRELRVNDASANTIKAYRADFAAFLGFVGDMEAQDITETRILEFLEFYEKGHAAKSVNRSKAALRGLFQMLLRKKVIKDDPTAWVRHAKVTTKTPPRYTPEEEEGILEKMAAEPEWNRDFTMFVLYFETGLRLHELRGLDIVDVEGKDVVEVIGKGKTKRFVPLDAKARAALFEYLPFRRAQRSDTDALFLSNRKTRISNRAIQARLARWKKAAGIDRKLGVHAARHRFAKKLLDATGNIRIVQAVLGHKNLNTTAIYTEMDVEDLKKGVESIADRGTSGDG